MGKANAYFDKNMRKFFSEQSFLENMPIISAVGLFCCDKFEETPNKKVSDLSKSTKPYFNNITYHVSVLSVNYDFTEFVCLISWAFIYKTMQPTYFISSHIGTKLVRGDFREILDSRICTWINCLSAS